MPENLPVPTSGGWFAEWIASGKLPGAAKAIAQLVGDTANAGSAWVNIITARGEQVQQRIRTETAGSKVVMDALAEEAARLGTSDPAIVEAALRQLGSSAIRKHFNRIEVLKNASDEMNSGEPVSETPKDIDDDWLNRFEELASNASSERIQKLLGKILAGEIRRPGNFSFATLNFINLLDTEVASGLAAIAPYTIGNDFVCFPQQFSFTPLFNEILKLKQYGVLSDTISRRIDTKEKYILLPGRGIDFQIGEIGSDQISLDIVPLTRIGIDIFPLVSVQSSDAHVENIVHQILQHIPCQWVETGSAIKIGENRYSFTPAKRYNRQVSQ